MAEFSNDRRVPADEVELWQLGLERFNNGQQAGPPFELFIENGDRIVPLSEQVIIRIIRKGGLTFAEQEAVTGQVDVYVLDQKINWEAELF